MKRLLIQLEESLDVFIIGSNTELSLSENGMVRNHNDQLDNNSGIPSVG